MRFVVALGGNALLRRGQPLTAENQRANVRAAAQSLAEIAADNDIVVSHGNGPQVGLLALQSATTTTGDGVFPLDLLGAQTEGMIGYVIERELGNLLPIERPFATLLTMVEVDPCDPAFDDPTKFIGPVYVKSESERLATSMGWTFKRDGQYYRRVVPSPEPKRIFEIRPIKWLLDRGTVVICAGGGGIPTTYAEGRQLVGVEAVIDKDLASSLLARQVEADMLLMATDVDAVYENFGTPEARALRRIAPEVAAEGGFPEGSMGPKVEAACTFVERTGRPAVIGSLTELAAMTRGEAGTTFAIGVETEYA